MDYRKRRLHFLIEGQNRLYQMFDQRQFKGYDRAAIDRLKRSFYGCIDVLNRREEAEFFSPETRGLVEELFPTAPSADDAKDLPRYARQFVEQHAEDRLLVSEVAAGSSGRHSPRIDHFCDEGCRAWHPEAAARFSLPRLSVWDVLTFPVRPARSRRIH